MESGYKIECYSTENVSEDVLKKSLGVDSLDNANFAIEIRDYDYIYFHDHKRNDTSCIAFAKLIELALSWNDAIVISRF
jgi:hypothetical protein